MRERPSHDVQVSALVPLPASEIFPTLVEELSTALGGARLRMEPGPGGKLFETGPDGHEVEVAHVVRWDPGQGIELAWHAPSWEDRAPTRMLIDLAPEEGGTRVTIRHLGWNPHQEEVPQGEELVGWFAQEIGATLLRSSSPQRHGDWLTDRWARRPSGRRGREAYGDPLYHRPAFRVMLAGLKLGPEDHLLEVGCGGGALLRDALRTGCRASALDHSTELLKVAAQGNAVALEDGRLRLVHGEADVLPFPDRSFSAAVMSGVLQFLERPDLTFQEIFRTLRPGGRLVVFVGTKKLRGTPAAPYPLADRVRYYEDAELASLAKKAGFSSVRVEHPEQYSHAVEVGIPKEHLDIFRDAGSSQLLWARRPSSGAPTARPRRTSPRASAPRRAARRGARGRR